VLRVLVVSGIWPPDPGGPASHAPEAAGYLAARGHRVEVVTTAAGPPSAASHPVHWASRRIPAGLRHLRTAELIRSAARRCDVVYSTGMEGRSALGSVLAGTPLVQRLTGDPAYERSLRFGLTAAPLDRFQHDRGGGIALLRQLRDRSLARAARIVCPSAALRDIVVGWGVEPERVEVLPHAVSAPALDGRDELRGRFGFDGPTLVYGGRFVRQKALDVALQALRPNQDVALVLAGDGPERPRIEGLARELGLEGRTCFLGVQPRRSMFELLCAADAMLLSSTWESFGLVAAEALAVGTPVLSPAVGGVAEVLEDGRNGLLVPRSDPQALAAAIGRYFGDPGLQESLRQAAAESAGRFAPERIYARLERILVAAADRRR